MQSLHGNDAPHRPPFWKSWLRTRHYLMILGIILAAAAILWLWHPPWFRYDYSVYMQLPVSKQWYLADLDSLDEDLKVKAATVLGAKALHWNAAPDLVPLLEDSAPRVRSRAINGLAVARKHPGPLPIISDRQLTEKLADLMCHDPSRSVRNRASGALRLLRDEGTSDPALQAQISDMLEEARSRNVVEKAPQP